MLHIHSSFKVDFWSIFLLLSYLRNYFWTATVTQMRRQPDPNSNKLKLAFKERRNTLRKQKKVYASLRKILEKLACLFTVAPKKTNDFFFLFFLSLLWKQEQTQSQSSHLSWKTGVWVKLSLLFRRASPMLCVLLECGCKAQTFCVFFILVCGCLLCVILDQTGFRVNSWNWGRKKIVQFKCKCWHLMPCTTLSVRSTFHL